jgi:hypothetical protein
LDASFLSRYSGSSAYRFLDCSFEQGIVRAPQNSARCDRKLRNRHATTHPLGLRNGPHASGRRRIAVLSGSEMCGTQPPTAQSGAARARRPAGAGPARNVPNRARNDQRAIVDDVALSSISVSSSDNRRARQARLPRRRWFNPPQPAARIAAEGGRLVTKGAQPMAGKEAGSSQASRSSPSGAVLDDDELYYACVT